MGFKMPHVLILVAIGCAGLALILQIVGVATPDWIKGGGTSTGLFKICSESKCVNIDDLPGKAADYVLACRAFGILGVLFLGGCVLVGALICFVENNKFPLIAAILGFVAGVCCLIGFAIFAGKNQDLVDIPGVDYGYSFFLTIAACILAFGAGVCFMLGKMKAT